MNGKKRNNIEWLTRTAVFIALLIILQTATAPLGNTIVTGSIVNLLLIVSVMFNGLWSGLTVAVISPAMAKFVGIGPFWALIPFVALGNAVLVLVWHFVGSLSIRNITAKQIASLAIAAVCKFLVLFLGIVKLAVPFILSVPEKQAAAITAMFSFPQIITASIGGLLAIIIFPLLQKAVNRRN